MGLVDRRATVKLEELIMHHSRSETIKMHLKAHFRKLQVKNRTEAAVLAAKESLSLSP